MEMPDPDHVNRGNVFRLSAKSCFCLIVCGLFVFSYSICYTKWQQSSGGESWTKTHMLHTLSAGRRQENRKSRRKQILLSCFSV